MPKIMTREEFDKVNHLGYVNGYASYKAVVEIALEHNHKHWIDDTYPTSPQLAQFYNEFKFKRRNIIAQWCNDSLVRVDLPDEETYYRVYRGINLGFKEAPEYVAGTLRMSNNKDGKWMYEVESSLIQNEKFSVGNEGYRIKRTKDFKAAVKNALAYIKPMTVERLKAMEAYDVMRAMGELKTPAQQKLSEITEVSEDDVKAELAHMVSSGYVPVTEHFAKALKVLREQGDELRRLEAYAPRQCWVWGRADNTVSYKYDNEAACEVTTVNDVPEFIRDKIAVLQIANVNTAVMDVGVRLSDRLFCVFV